MNTLGLTRMIAVGPSFSVRAECILTVALAREFIQQQGWQNGVRITFSSSNGTLLTQFVREEDDKKAAQLVQSIIQQANDETERASKLIISHGYLYRPSD